MFCGNVLCMILPSTLWYSLSIGSLHLVLPAVPACSESSALIVQDAAALDRLLPALQPGAAPPLPLRFVVLLWGRPSEEAAAALGPRLHTFEEVLERGRGQVGCAIRASWPPLQAGGAFLGSCASCCCSCKALRLLRFARPHAGSVQPAASLQAHARSPACRRRSTPPRASLAATRRPWCTPAVPPGTPRACS
jgi:hypothetical protein